MGIWQAYINWIPGWLSDRRAIIEVQGKISKWVTIQRGDPQGSRFTPTLFITYHSDMVGYIPMIMSFFLADDLDAILTGRIGI